MSSSTLIAASTYASMQRTRQIKSLQFRDPMQFTPRERRVKHVMETELWKLSRADTTEDPDEHYQVTGSRTSRAWSEYGNLEREQPEDPEWRMDAEWLRIFARTSWPPENRDAELRRVDRFIQHRIDWYVDAEEELAAWDDKVARIRGDYDEWYTAWDDAIKELGDGGEVGSEMEGDERAMLVEEEYSWSSSVATTGDVDERAEQTCCPSKFVECLCAVDGQARCPVRCGGSEKVDPTGVQKRGPFLKELLRKTNIFRKVKGAQMAYRASLVKNWYADGR